MRKRLMRTRGALPTGRRIAVIGLRGMPGVIGGIERHSELLYPELAKIAPELTIHVVARTGYVPRRVSRLNRVAIVAIAAPKGGAIEALIHTPLALIVAAVRLRPDLVHLHGIGPGFYAPLARLLGMKTVVTHHASDFLRPKWAWPGRFFLRMGEAIAAASAHRVICVSNALRREFTRRHPLAGSRTVTIRHGVSLADVDAAAAAAIHAELKLVPGRYILAVGRLEETKRFDDLILAHSSSRTPLPLVIVGSTYRPSAYADALRAHAGPNVVFAGFRTGAELSALYAGAALFIHASEMEGFGLVILEAMAMGVPVRLSDIAPHREFDLPDNAFFPVGDVRAITRILDAATPRTVDFNTPRTGDTAVDARAMVLAHRELFRQLLSDQAKAAQ